VAQKRLGAGGGGEIGDLVRHQAEIGRHPDRAEPERREHRPEHLVAILGMHQQPVALGDAARGQAAASAETARSISRQVQDLSPQMKPCGRHGGGHSGSQMRQIHHPVRHPHEAAARRRLSVPVMLGTATAQGTQIIIVTLLKPDLNVPAGR
jgi:hypothetical protein